MTRCSNNCTTYWHVTNIVAGNEMGYNFPPSKNNEWLLLLQTIINMIWLKCAELVDDVGGRSTIFNISNGTGRERGYNFPILKHNEWWKGDLLIQVWLYYINMHLNSIVLKVHFSSILKTEICVYYYHWVNISD